MGGATNVRVINSDSPTCRSLFTVIAGVTGAMRDASVLTCTGRGMLRGIGFFNARPARGAFA
jgi:hypothetical protein